jgi:hypothetical protein
MISQCANPACNKPFHYRRGGRLYRFEMIGQGAGAEAVSNVQCSSGYVNDALPCCR